jgi:hypothetical protein
VSRETERLAREIVRAEVLAKRAEARFGWDEAEIWWQTRDQLRDERSRVMRQEIDSGEWWPVRREVA